MKQLLQYNRQKGPRVTEVPSPQMKGKGLLVANKCSLISVGTERQMIEVSQMSLLGKAKARPDMVKQVIGKMKSEGIVSTYNKVMGRLSTPTSLGYSSAGVVERTHAAIENYVPGDRVACAGFGYAAHAERIFVPANLAVKIPGNVTFEEASFVTLGAIAMQGVRIADVRLGETVAVVGLGLLGQITVMLLAASGCRVLGIDIDAGKTKLAIQSGAEAAFVADGFESAAIANFTTGHGADAVIITAASESSKPIETAGQICRDKGRVVVVGAVKMDVPRKSFYDKELELRLSRSYGPGRYDYYYEEEDRITPLDMSGGRKIEICNRSCSLSPRAG
jgi:polar amino acid transport system substrate-binding protein